MKKVITKENLAAAKTWTKEHKKLVTAVAIAIGFGVLKKIICRSNDDSDLCDIPCVNAEEICTAYGINYSTPDEAVKKALHEFTWAKDYLSEVCSRAGSHLETYPKIDKIEFYAD